LQAPAGQSTRPTSDRLRETLFNVLAPRIGGASFLDLYAGSGAVGIEALSRGAARVMFVERAAAAMKVLRTNLGRLGVQTGFGFHAGTATSFLRGPRGGGMEFDVVFLDPPYEAELEYAAVLGLLGGDAVRFLAAGAMVIAEHRRKHALDGRFGVLARARLLEQGDAALSFYTAVDGSTNR
jgi:16S rRNA (guanine966-N2)-methyltransferase